MASFLVAPDPLWCSWFSGLIDGEGHFKLNYYAKGDKFAISLLLQLREDDKDVIDGIHKTLIFGSVYHSSSQCYRDKGQLVSDSYVWQMSGIRNINEIIIPLLDEYPLRTKKKKDYLLWRVAALLIYSKKNKTIDGKIILHAIIKALKEIRKGPYIKSLKGQLPLIMQPQ